MKNINFDCCPGPESLEEMPGDEQELNAYLARLAKALGHPVRVAIMRLLIRRGSCIGGEIVDEFSLAQSTVSQHLKQLKSAGLVRGEIDGPRVCFCVEPAAVAMLRALIEDLISTQVEG